MNTRYTNNPNIHLHTSTEFNGLPVQTSHGDLAQEYLERIQLTINRSLQEHPRTLAIRVDLRVPNKFNGYLDSGVIKRFIASLRKQISYDSEVKRNAGDRVHPCTVRYVWAKESTGSHFHYHLVLFVNHDRFNCLGDYSATEGNLSARIRRAWASALGMSLEDTAGAIYFPDNCLYKLDVNAVDFNEVYRSLLYRVSYLAKIKTKVYGNNDHTFGSSRV